MDWYEIKEFLAEFLDKIGDKLYYYLKLFILGLSFVYAAGFFSHTFPALAIGLRSLIMLMSVLVFCVNLFLMRFQSDGYGSIQSRLFWVSLPGTACMLAVWALYYFGVFVAGGLL